MMYPNSQYYVEGASGVKTGSIDTIVPKKGDGWDYDNVEYGSRALVTTAMRDGYTYMIVFIGKSAAYLHESRVVVNGIFGYKIEIVCGGVGQPPKLSGILPIM